ncbi:MULTISPECIES: AAA family ATPase [unclassified Streptomyces]|uniref:ATP-binding protein n=1 Tax=unclassified Streptomyces TaxID=2593676 RepID=UPI000CD58590|nr:MULTISPECIES: LuxR family transcriptional regulator [unclassified Streptomyces]
MLVQRDAELDAIREALADATEGLSSLNVVAGPLGIGRSALLHRLPRYVAPGAVRTLWATAVPEERDLPFGVVRQLLDGLLLDGPRGGDGTPGEDGPHGEAPGEHGRWAARVEHALELTEENGGTAGTGGDPDAVAEAVRSLLAEPGAHAPPLVLVDDLQWADAPSLRWLAHAAARPDGPALVLVCTVRDGDPGARDGLVRDIVESADRVLRPAPLSLATTGWLVRELLGEPADEEFVRACHQTACGRPLFLMSLLSELGGTGRPPLAAHVPLVRAARPEQLRDRVVSGLGHQPRAVRETASALATLRVAVQDGSVLRPLLARLAGLDDAGTVSALRSLRRLGLVEGGVGEDRGAARYVQPGVREAVEYAMDAAERRQRHTDAARLLYELGRPAEEVAAQLESVAGGGCPWAVPVLRDAADSARRRGAPDRAVRYLRRALLDVPEQGPTRARLLVELAATEIHSDAPAAESHLAQALPLLPTAAERAEAVLVLSPCVVAPLTPAGVELLRASADELSASGPAGGTPGEEALRVEARLRYAGLADPGRLTDATGRLRTADGADGSGGGRELLAVLLHAATLSAGAEASEVARRARSILEREPASVPGPGSVIQLVLFSLMAADAVEAAEPWLNAAEQRPAPGGSDALRHSQRALLHVARGRLPRAREEMERVLTAAGTVGAENRDFVLGVLCAVALSARDVQLGSLVAAEARGSAFSPLQGVLAGMLRMPEQARAGDPAAALETAMECGRQLESVGWRNPVLFPWRPWAVSLAQRTGDHHLARALATEEYARAREWGAPVGVGRALRLLARTDGVDERVGMLRESVAVLRGSANELELLMALRDLGRLLGDGAEAREVLREAGELAESCGAPWPVDRAAPGPARSAGPVRATLTRTENRVALLVVTGFTNREIAAELKVSVRAVEKHLTHVYRKFGVKGRRGLSAHLYETELNTAG